MDLDTTSSTDAELATQACTSCRRQKRRCDKQLPSCSLCVRLNRSCDYSIETQNQTAPPTSEDFAALRQQVADLTNLISSKYSEQTPPSDDASNGTDIAPGNTGIFHSSLRKTSPLAWPGASTFPSLFFLDSNAFGYARQTIQTPSIRVPPGALAALGSSIELREMIEHYFTTVHSYFPVISKIRLYQHLSNPTHEPDAAIALLFLCMKLACTQIPSQSIPQTDLYQDIKSFYRYVEAQNGFSIHTIQAILLIALYEVSHGIYPAAYLTINNAATFGHATGLHDKTAPQMLPRCTTWTEQEERRRLWWGILILDRFVHIGNRGKPFATTEPSVETHLPTDDAAWDQGQMLAAAPLSLSASPSVFASPFARTCQAAHLLGKVLRHIDDKTIPMEYRFDEAMQLHRTMCSFADAILYGEPPDESPPSCAALFTSLAMTYSGLLTLYDAYSCTESARESGGEPQLLMQKQSIDGLKEVSNRTIDLSRQIRRIIEDGKLDKISPMIIDCIYQAAASCKFSLSHSHLVRFCTR